MVTPYQGRGVGAIEAVDGDRRLDILGRGRGGVAARRDAGKGSLGSCGAGGAECWSGEHGDVTMGGRQLGGGEELRGDVVVWSSAFCQLQNEQSLQGQTSGFRTNQRKVAASIRLWLVGPPVRPLAQIWLSMCVRALWLRLAN